MGKHSARQIVTGEEQDAYTGWRRVLAYMQRPGAVSDVKRRTHKRERRDAQRDIGAFLDDLSDDTPTTVIYPKMDVVE